MNQDKSLRSVVSGSVKYCPLAADCGTEHPDLCPSFQEDLYQSGSLLHEIQHSDILHDGKEFVDRPALVSPNTVYANWRKLLNENKQLTHPVLIDFVEKHFGKSGWELEKCAVPSDFDKFPAYLDGISDAGLILLGQEIHDIWMELGARVKQEVLEMKGRTSMLYIPNFFVIPGGRFKVSILI